VIEYFKILRPEHWLKNIFIVFGHLVAVVLFIGIDHVTAGHAGLAALSLIPACLIASANYILNEILDAPFDAIHPTKKLRGIPAGKVKVKVCWALMVAMIVGGLGLGMLWFNWAYVAALILLLLSGLVYNVQPIRLKDRAFADVIAESFNNPIRLWLGFYALEPPNYLPPLSIVLAWWFFGALLMTGKRYTEYRFIGDKELSGQYRRSFKTYTERRLIIAMITYANLFCFSTGIAMAVYQELNNLVLVFPFIVIAIIIYFRHAMKEETARMEPEQLMRNPLLLASTALVGGLSLWLLHSDTNYAKAIGLLGKKIIGE